MKILQLGAGLMGRAITLDLVRNASIERITVVDADARSLKETETFVASPNDLRLSFKKIDVTDKEKIKPLMAEHDTVVSAVTYKYNYELASLAVQCGCNFCDLGGNNTIVQKELGLHDKARKKNVTVIPDCGLAPGMVSVLVADGIARMETVEDVQIRVGGLPRKPQPPMNYMLVFSVHGLINEYVEKCYKLKDGRIVETDPMVDVEDIIFDEPFGRLEAFNTSGGTSTLPQTYAGRIQNLDYKTIRYRGHAAQFKLLMDLGLTDARPLTIGDTKVVPREVLASLLEEKLSMPGKDCVLVRVTVRGTKGNFPKEVVYEIIDFGDESSHVTAMMKMTAYPISVIAQMLSAGKITEKGAVPQELAVPSADFIAHLRRRNMDIRVSET